MRFGSTVGRRVKLQASCVEERRKEKKKEGEKRNKKINGFDNGSTVTGIAP